MPLFRAPLRVDGSALEQLHRIERDIAAARTLEAPADRAFETAAAATDLCAAGRAERRWSAADQATIDVLLGRTHEAAVFAGRPVYDLVIKAAAVARAGRLIAVAHLAAAARVIALARGHAAENTEQKNNRSHALNQWQSWCQRRRPTFRGVTQRAAQKSEILRAAGYCGGRETPR